MLSVTTCHRSGPELPEVTGALVFININIKLKHGKKQVDEN